MSEPISDRATDGRQPSGQDELAPPVLLMSMPQVMDPFFHKSVVLLIHHDDDGSLGFIVNRPTDIQVNDILNGMQISWNGEREAVVHFGGPVQPQLGTVLYGAEEGFEITEAATEVIPGAAITQHSDDLRHLAQGPPKAFRLLLGYAGWGAGQLVEEILRNDWLTAPAAHDLIFHADTGAVWEAALRSVGVDPAVLPSWTGGESDSGAN